MPAHRIIVLDDDGKPKSGTVAGGTLGPNISKSRTKNNTRSHAGAIKQEAIDIERLGHDVVSLKRRRSDSAALPTISKEIIDLEDAPGAFHTNWIPAQTIKYDLTDLESPFGKKVKVERDPGTITTPVCVGVEDDNTGRDSANLEEESRGSFTDIKIEEEEDDGHVAIEHTRDCEVIPADIKSEGDTEMSEFVWEEMGTPTMPQEATMTEEEEMSLKMERETLAELAAIRKRLDEA